MMQSGRPNLPLIALKALGRPAIWPAPASKRTLARQLARSFTDPRLRQLFGRYATYVGGCPDLSPAVLSLIWQAEAQGVWAVQGGTHQLARALADLASRLGVTLRYGVTAQKIVRKSGRVTEVILSEQRPMKCDAVVFNGDPAALLAGLLGNGPQQALAPGQAHPRSLSAWVWSFAATPSATQLIHHNVFFASDPAREFGR
jgi:1-hydroxycarotenoid 3,4-desaturase